jgi:hypothetical protein
MRFDNAVRNSPRDVSTRRLTQPPYNLNSRHFAQVTNLETGLRGAFPSSSSPMEAGFGEIDIVLDAAEDFVIDRLVVAQGDNGFAFCVQGFAG